MAWRTLTSLSDLGLNPFRGFPWWEHRLPFLAPRFLQDPALACFSSLTEGRGLCWGYGVEQSQPPLWIPVSPPALLAVSQTLPLPSLFCLRISHVLFPLPGTVLPSFSIDLAPAYLGLSFILTFSETLTP